MITIEQARNQKVAAKEAFEKLGAKVATVGITRAGEDYELKLTLHEPLPKGVRAPKDIDGVRVWATMAGDISIF